MDPSLAQDHKMEEISDPNSRVVSYFDKVDTKANRPLSQKHNSGKERLETYFFLAYEIILWIK